MASTPETHGKKEMERERETQHELTKRWGLRLICFSLEKRSVRQKTARLTPTVPADAGRMLDSFSCSRARLSALGKGLEMDASLAVDHTALYLSHHARLMSLVESALQAVQRPDEDLLQNTVVDEQLEALASWSRQVEEAIL